MSSEISDILASFSSNQLRDLALAMGSHGVATPKASLTKEGLIALLGNKKSDPTLALFAHRIEAVTPYKHLFVYSLEATDLSLSKAVTRIKKAFPNLIGSLREIDSRSDEMDVQACLIDETQSRIYLKLVHQVEMSGWVAISRTEKRLKEFRKRHPVVVTLRLADGIVTVGFPGFTYTQGVQHDERATYPSIAAQASNFITNNLAIKFVQFNAKPAIDAFLEEEPEEVIDVKRSVRPQKGGRFAFDAGEEGKLTTALTEFLSKEGDIPVSEAQIRSLLRRSGASDVLLVWKKLGILTRVALLHDGPEFLFIWRDSGPSSTVVDSVLTKVASYERLLKKPGVNVARKEVLASPLDRVVTPAMLAQQHGISQADVMEILSVALSKGDFEPRFRVNVDAVLLDFPNTWFKSPSDLPKNVTDEHGNTIDLATPSNIEVGFERVR
jgi:hypothetical protein